MSSKKTKQKNAAQSPGLFSRLARKTSAYIRSLWEKIDWRDPAWIFLAIVVLAGLILIYQMLPKGFFRDLVSSQEGLMRVTLNAQTTPITNLNQPPDETPSQTNTFLIDTVDFPGGNLLRHERLGEFQFSRDFFTRIDGEFEVLTAGDYKFIVSSDDGFRLTIDGNVISEFTNDRPMAETEAGIALSKGRHSFTIQHFQGYGQLGLQAWYSGPACERLLIGKHSSCLRFIPQPEAKAADPAPETVQRDKGEQQDEPANKNEAKPADTNDDTPAGMNQDAP